jgi:uncharacterized protein with FMN-binding domain
MNNPGITRLIAVIAVLVLGAGAFFYATSKKSSTPETPAATTAVTTTVANEAAASASNSQFKDGTYSATGTYTSPGGDEKIGVTLTLQNDIVTAASVAPMPVSEDGQRFQARFAKGFKQYVVGKKITDINLTTVSGSSLTPIGFKNALTQIEAQAKA